jgi:hypothetical protein
MIDMVTHDEYGTELSHLDLFNQQQFVEVDGLEFVSLGFEAYREITWPWAVVLLLRTVVEVELLYHLEVGEFS